MSAGLLLSHSARANSLLPRLARCSLTHGTRSYSALAQRFTAARSKPLAARAANPLSSKAQCRQSHSVTINNDTIFATSTHPGKAAIAIIRVSGPQTAAVLQQMIPRYKHKLPTPRKALMTKIVDPLNNSNTLDMGICIWFPGPNSYTGEDMLEFHVHGGIAVVTGILTALSKIKGLRMAQAGEFSKRSFDNEKMDLTTLEGIADLINAETEAQRKLAIRQTKGELYQKYESWRLKIINMMAQIEAFIDFSEEENIEEGIYPLVYKQVKELASDISGHLDDKRKGEILRNGVQLSIVGPPNSGKSTLLNMLAQRQVAIVSPIEGTTRDIIETTLDIDGFPVVVKDTAGLRLANDVIEIEGIKRALEAAKHADIRIVMLDASKPLLADAENELSIDSQILSMPHTFVVLNKADMLSDVQKESMVKEWAVQNGIRNQTCLISLSSLYGWDTLMKLLAKDIKSTWETGTTQQMPLTKIRYRQNLELCLAHLNAFKSIDEDLVVLAAEELRKASEAIGRITGKVGIEDVLDALFSQFCIGK